MFVRVKTTPNSPRKAVQLVEGVRVEGKVRQRIVRHVGVATDEAELLRLRELGEYLKARIAEDRQPGLFPPEQVAEQVIEAGRASARAPDPAPLPVDLKALREERRIVTGIHEAYGVVYRELGFDRLLSSRHRASAPALHHTVMARIANPDSKRATVRRLGRDFGVSLALEKVYRMMDRLDDKLIDRLKLRVASATEALLGEPLEVLFFDCTTLYFESVAEDGDADALRAFGYSKDGKAQRVQVVLALAVTREDLPVGYEVFPGATYEGHTFLPTIEALRRRHTAAEAVCVADAAMFGRENLSALEAAGHRYIVGARLRNLPGALKARILNVARYRALPGAEAGRKVGVFRHRGRRLLVAYSPRRARKDAADRQRAVRKLLKQLNRSGQPKSLVPRGAARFVRMRGKGRWEIDPDRIAEAARWDGLHGVATNVRGMPVEEILERYRGLWQVERSFRITKHDLKVRPIYHWTPRRIRAHLAIAYMAFACVRHLAYRVKLQKKRNLSPQAIRDALLHRQCSVLRHTGTGQRYAIPSSATTEAQLIYEALGLTLSDVPYALN
ncbi:MAG: IS1634 family transposase [Rhodospirillaceae bacterium]|nr:IS1634 family transposase [Rhodospirillaceae bacterium]